MHKCILITIAIATLVVVGVASRYRVSAHRVESAGIVVLYARTDPPEFRTHCPAGQCIYVELDGFECSEKPVQSVEVLIVSGHSSPPEYLSAPPTAISRVVQCLAPRLVVLDTCYGFSSPLLVELASIPSPMLVVGATFKLPPDGLVYEDAFYTAQSPQERALYVRSRSGAKLENWWTDPDALRATLATVATWKRPVLLANLQRKLPNLVRAPIHGSGATLLVPVPPERFLP